MSSSITLQKTIGITSKFIYNAPLLYINSGDLAYSIGDYVRQFMLAPPFAWRWNRAATSPVICQAGQSDYLVNAPDFGWLEKASITYPVISNNTANIVTATRSGNVVTLVLTVNPATLGFYAGQGNLTVAGVLDSSFDGYQAFTITSLTSNSIIYAQTGANAVSSGGTVSNYNTQLPNTPVVTKELTVRETLSLESVLGQPAFISPVFDDNNGNITFRVMPTPDTSYSLNVIYQKAAPTFSSVQDTWNPIPDYFSYLFNLGFLAKTYEYKGDERFAFAHQEFLKQLVAASEGLTETQKNIFLGPLTTYQRELQGSNQRTAIGNQSRIG